MHWEGTAVLGLLCPGQSVALEAPSEVSPEPFFFLKVELPGVPPLMGSGLEKASSAHACATGGICEIYLETRQLPGFS